MATHQPKQQRARVTRAKILLAAQQEFAAHGYDAASTRAIAKRAGTHQPQINYHFDSKESLWRELMTEFHITLGEHLPDSALFEASPVEALQDLVCAMADLCVSHPEMMAMSAQVGTVDSARLRWIFEEHYSKSFDPFAEAFERAAGLSPDPHRRLVLYYTLVGAATTMYTRAPAGLLLTGVSPYDDQCRELHRKLLRAMVVTAVDLFKESDS